MHMPSEDVDFHLLEVVYSREALLKDRRDGFLLHRLRSRRFVRGNDAQDGLVHVGIQANRHASQGKEADHPKQRENDDGENGIIHAIFSRWLLMVRPFSRLVAARCYVPDLSPVGDETSPHRRRLSLQPRRPFARGRTRRSMFPFPRAVPASCRRRRSRRLSSCPPLD